MSPAQVPDAAVLRGKRRDQEALQFMRGIMDECTHLRNYDTPVDTSLIIAVCAKDDAYVPREGCADLTDIWPGAEVRYLNSGHVGAFLLHHQVFRCVTFRENTDKAQGPIPLGLQLADPRPLHLKFPIIANRTN